MTVWSYCLELQMQGDLEDTDEEIELICSHLSMIFHLIMGFKVFPNQVLLHTHIYIIVLVQQKQ
jgi:hypothetical protein